jgi:hypothetical protein
MDQDGIAIPAIPRTIMQAYLLSDVISFMRSVERYAAVLVVYAVGAGLIPSE